MIFLCVSTLVPVLAYLYLSQQGQHKCSGRAGQHFDLFNSVFDTVNTVTTEHRGYACRTQSSAMILIWTNSGVRTTSVVSFFSPFFA